MDLIRLYKMFRKNNHPIHKAASLAWKVYRHA